MSEPQPHPFLDPSFHVAWSTLEPAVIEDDITLALKKAQERIDAIAGQAPEEATYESTILALEDASQELDRGWGYASHLTSVCEGPDIRKAFNAMLPKVTEFSTRICLNAELWSVIKAVAEKPATKQLTGPHARLVEDTLRSFRDHGADLPEDRREEFQSLNNELSSITQKFGENVLDSTKAWDLIIEDEAELAGIPEGAKEAMREDALGKGHGTEDAPQWRITLHMPSYLPVMQYAESEDLRRQVWLAATTIGKSEGHDNTELIGKILRLRQRKAELLDRKDFADLLLAPRMVKNGAAALDFVETLHDKVAAPFASEVEELQAYKAEQTGGSASDLFEPWQTMYWAEKRRQAQFDFDEEELRPYFPLHHVIDGLFALTERLFGVSIVKRSTFYIDPKTGAEKRAEEPGDNDAVEVWHSDVRFYDLLDGDGTHLGSFYADWFPRESKRAGAWMNALRTGGESSTGFKPHLGLMAGNMTKPTKAKPELMTHREVETIFHEFGHLLHHLLGRVEIKSLNGTNVAWDFVELPSQIMENWCWEREALDLFARHYASDETIPDELFAKMQAARNYMQGSATMRQLSLGKLDLELHINYAKDAADSDLDALLDKILEGYVAQYATKPPSIVRRFTHLFSDPTGYACGYYSYKWAEVLEADCFTRFKAEGVLNKATGKAFRECILEKGDSEPPEKLFRDFMGRDPDSNALLRRAGLLV